ncbi:MAG: fasciclin domain-containing protein [Clostridium sp.]|nr:fasciclin domain-containing protein [Clostridium sp.]
MRYLTITCRSVLAAMLLAVAGACSDNWDSHYEPQQPDSGETLYQMIAADPNLSVFKQMVDIAGYDKVLSETQTYTVWAPVNTALGEIDLSDQALVRRTVLNHIARFNRSTSTPGSEGIRMINGKKFRFDGRQFAGVDIIDSDMMATNGVLHTLDAVVPYAYNIREYIDSHSETSLISDFISRFDQKIFDLGNSKPIDVNENGETVYDSVIIEYNRLLEYPVLGIGSIADEDSVYTMVIPTDNAWNDAYDRIKPWFVTDNDSITDVQTSLAVFSNQIFRADITAPAGFDILKSTTGSVYQDIDALFANAVRTTASNGAIWLTPALGQRAVESWNPELEIESEATITRRPDQASRTTCRVMSVNADHELAPQISELSYIYATSSSLSNPKVEFTIENPLSGKYEIHAFFVPAIADNPTATDEQTRLKFSVIHPRSAGASRTTTVNFTNNNFVTSTDAVTDILVGEITFPCSHFVDRLRLMDETYDQTSDTSPFKITVETNVTQSEFNAGTYVRSFRIDRVVLVPVVD